jgi:YfiH family protein
MTNRKRYVPSFPAGTITIPAFAEGMGGVTHVFGTRSACPPDEFGEVDSGLHTVAVRQVHGTEALILHRRMTEAEVREAASAKGFDAIITDRPRTWVTVRTADCVPILLIGADHGIVASVHAGWRGTVEGIAGKVIRLMHDIFGCTPSLLRAAIGPSIGRCCYEVDEPVMKPLKRAFPYWSEALEETTAGRGQLDLRRLNRLALEEAGVDPGRIAAVNLCTACHPDLFYSYRRDGKATRHMTSGIALLE